MATLVRRAKACSIQVEDVFGPQVHGCLGDFDFTLLLEESILILPMTAVALLTTILRLRYLLKEPIKVNGGWHPISKIVGLGLLSVLNLALLGFWARPATPKTRLTLATAVITATMSLISIALSYLEHFRTIRPSSIIILFLLFTTLFDAARTRTLWNITENRTVATLMSGSVGLRILLLGLEGLGKQSSLKHVYKDASAESTTGIMGQSLFWWLNPLLRRGYKELLATKDLMTLDGDFVVQPNRKNSLYLKWKEGMTIEPNALLFASIKHYKWSIIIGIIPRFAQIGFFFAQPYLVGRTTAYVGSPSGSRSEGYGLIGAFAFVYSGIAISTAVAQHKAYRLVAMIRGSLVEVIYLKTMVMESTSIEESAPVTLMSADIERIGTGLRFTHDAWACMLEIPLALYLLWRELGVASMAPLGVAILCMIGAVCISGLAGERQGVWLEAIQTRVDATAQMLGTMKGVKMTGLTNKLYAMIHKHREEEITKSQKFRELLIIMVGISFSNIALSPVICFAIYTLLARHNGTQTLSTSKAFTSIALFNILAVPIQNLVQSVAGLATAVGSIERINKFLLEEPRRDGRTRSDLIVNEELLSEDEENSFKLKPQKRTSDHVTLFEGKVRSAGWTNEKPNIVNNLSFQIQPLSLTMVVGPVGCGKSTFIHALLGETPVFNGYLNYNSSAIAYCGQNCWLKNDTVQKNILGESKFDLQWYNIVLRACGLDHDIKVFPHGDQAMVGSKGAVLSGGQKQRIAIARAVYSKLPTVILDDVFSGLDPTTEDHVFSCLLGAQGIWRKRETTVIMTTNNIQRLPYSDHIIVLGEDGKLAEQGSFFELNSRKGYVQKLEITNFNSRTSKTVKGALPEEPLANPANEIPREEGDRRTGDTTVYFYYVKTMGFKRSLVFLLLLACYVVCVTYPNIWVEKWTHFNETHPNEQLGYWLGIYAMLGGLSLIFILSSCWHLMKSLVATAARKFHRELLNTVLNAPMTFFSTTDVGVTLNRFSQDLQLIDMELPLALLNSVLSFLTCISQLVVICVTTKYLAAIVPLAIGVFYLIQRYYLRTSRQLRFLDIESKSPLFSHFLESLSGLVTIRSYGWVEEYCARNSQHINNSQKPFYLLYCIQRWLELVVSLSVAGLAVLLVGVAVATKGQISAGFIGVALINIVTFSENLQALITHWTVLETSIGAISRIRAFAKTPSENQLTENSLPPKNWPERGSIEFREVSASYKVDADPVLRSISLKIPGGKKVGICGRTGSGKSSLVSTLFRILDINSGAIYVDGVDLSTLPRQIIRERLVVVPQDPYLFDGSVRLNIDPSESLSDDDIISALEKVHLWDIVKESGGLNARVTNDFFSHGQKQLLCIASAMLRKGNILVLDEATSSVDAETDALVATLIRSEFANHTIIAIAHRLDSIIDYDQVIYMDKGEIKESGNPKILVATPGSHFRDLYLDLNHGRTVNRTPLPF
ncbi:putative ABC multidrug transporter [Tricladium varicosporioides]|nr:putative ABC multidrug transporter [Hymenoscyphus varicosporioides]